MTYIRGKSSKQYFSWLDIALLMLLAAVSLETYFWLDGGKGDTIRKISGAVSVSSSVSPLILIKEDYKSLFEASPFTLHHAVDDGAVNLVVPLGLVDTPEGQKVLIRFTGSQSIKLMAPDDKFEGWRLTGFDAAAGHVQMEGPEGVRDYNLTPSASPESTNISTKNNALESSSAPNIDIQLEVEDIIREKFKAD